MLREMHVYLSNGVLVLSSYWQTESGLSILGDFADKYPDDVADEVLGGAVKLALNNTLSDQPYPGPAALIPRLKKLYQLAGVKSEGRYMAGARSVLVLDGGAGELTFIPTKNEGRRGFSHLVDQKFSVPRHEIDNAEIGRCVRAALERSS